MTNSDFEKLVDTSDEWITTRTGIKERRIAADDESCSDMAAAACGKALEMAEVKNEEIELLVLGTVTPDYRLPSSACVVQEKIGLPNAVGFDVAAACTGFISGLSVANAFIESGRYKKILVAGADKLSAITNYTDRNTCVLFGDAAGAAVVAADDNGRGVLSTFMKSDGSMRKMLWTKVGGTAFPLSADFEWDGTDKILMSGSDVFKIAVREMGNAARIVLEKSGLTADDISLVIPHQANLRIIEAMVKRLGIGMDRVFLNIDRYGNTSAASVPLALDEANRQGRLKPGDIVMMVAFGGGLIWGSALVKW